MTNATWTTMLLQLYVAELLLLSIDHSISIYEAVYSLIHAMSIDIDMHYVVFSCISSHVQ